MQYDAAPKPNLRKRQYTPPNETPPHQPWGVRGSAATTAKFHESKGYVKTRGSAPEPDASGSMPKIGHYDGPLSGTADT